MMGAGPIDRGDSGCGESSRRSSRHPPCCWGPVRRRATPIGPVRTCRKTHPWWRSTATPTRSAPARRTPRSLVDGICEERGWREFNPSVNGLGFVNNRDGLGARPARPDHRGRPRHRLHHHGTERRVQLRPRRPPASGIGSRTTSSACASALPDARFIVVEPFWYTEERPESIETIIDWVGGAPTRSTPTTSRGRHAGSRGARARWRATDSTPTTPATRR